MKYEDYESMQNKRIIHYRDLSSSLKAAVIFVWIMMILYLISFLGYFIYFVAGTPK